MEDRIIPDEPLFVNSPVLHFIFESAFEVEIYVKIAANYICESSKQFDRSKIIELPLKPCEMKEIEDWLYKFSCLPSEIVEQSLSIVRSTDRRPERVYDFFRDRLIEYLQKA